MAIWVGGDEQIFNRHKPVLDAMGDQAAYIGPIGAGSSPSSCTIAPARSWGWRSPRSSRWASRPGSTRSICGRRCARARPAGCGRRADAPRQYGL
jgi:hypothetical protein